MRRDEVKNKKARVVVLPHLGSSLVISSHPSFGYSLLEVIVALFVLLGVVMATFSIFENGGRQTVKLENAMVAVRLAQQIGEELHSKSVSRITVPDSGAFQSPFNQYYYSVRMSAYPDPNVDHLQKVGVIVTGPVDSFNNPTSQTTKVSLSFLLGRQPYPLP